MSYAPGGYRLSNLEVRSILERCQADPVFFANNILGVRLWKKQRIVLRALCKNRRVMVKSCHGAGKTFLAAVAVLWFSFCFYESRVLTTAPTFRQVEKILWQEVKKLYENSRIPLGGKMYTTQMKVDTGWFAMGFSTEDPDAFQGHHAKHMLVIFDEACGIDPKIWEACEGVLTGRHAVLLGIGNPTDPDTPFNSEFQPRSPAFKMGISAFDTPNFTKEFATDKDPDGFVDGLVTPEWVEEKRKKWGEDSAFWFARVLGEFPPGASDALVPLSWIEKAQNRMLEASGSKEFGIDVARYGDAETVIYLRRGNVLRLVGAYNGLDTVQVSDKISNLIKQHTPERVKIDEVGVGAGVVDVLKSRHGRKLIKGVQFGEAADDKDLFLNRRAEIFWNLRKKFEDNEIDIDVHDEELAAQLSKIRYRYDAKNRIVIERKEEMRRRQLPSPDRADTAAIAFAPARKAVASGEVKF